VERSKSHNINLFFTHSNNTHNFKRSSSNNNMSSPPGTRSVPSFDVVFSAEDAARTIPSGCEEVKERDHILDNTSSRTHSNGSDKDSVHPDIASEPPFEHKKYVDSLVDQMSSDKQRTYHGYLQSAATCADPTEVDTYVSKAEAMLRVEDQQTTSAEPDTTLHSSASILPGEYFAPKAPSSHKQ
jgi:hypothetical protein